MIDYELYARIKRLHEEGLKPSQIARRLEVDPRTVARWLSEKGYRPRTGAPRTSLLDPFKATILRLLESHPFSAAQILARLREEGFQGGYTIVKDYVRKVRPNRAPAYLKLAFAPGECAQVDWGSSGSIRVGETRRRLSFFVMVLCYSRMMYVEFTLSQTMEHFLACHQNAFTAFGGVVQKVMVDNLKSAVLRRLLGQSPVLNPRYLDFAQAYGFTIVPCGVRKANEKGRVESGVGYVKKNFLAGLDPPGFEALNPAIRHWLEATANVRVHGETHRQPVEMFKEERAHLLPLPPHPFDVGVVSPVRASSQFRVTVETNHYSVPAEYAGARLTLKAYPDRLCIYCEDRLIARHPRCYERHRDFEDPDHPKALLAQRRKARDQVLIRRFLALSGRAGEYYAELEKRRLNVRHHVEKIVALSEIYGPEKLERAIDDALAFKAFSCEYVANLLEQRSRSLPEPAALHLSRNEDLLDLDVPKPDLSVYETKKETR